MVVYSVYFISKVKTMRSEYQGTRAPCHIKSDCRKYDCHIKSLKKKSGTNHHFKKQDNGIRMSGKESTFPVMKQHHMDFEGFVSSAGKCVQADSLIELTHFTLLLLFP